MKHFKEGTHKMGTKRKPYAVSKCPCVVFLRLHCFVYKIQYTERSGYVKPFVFCERAHLRRKEARGVLFGPSDLTPR